MEPIEVVAGIVVREPEILVTRRREGNPLGGFWEFPGGKTRPGECPREALERELCEELEIRAVGALWGVLPARHGGRSLTLWFYFAGIENGRPRPVVCEELRWAEPHALDPLPFPEPDRVVLDALIQCARQGIPLYRSRHTSPRNQEEEE